MFRFEPVAPAVAVEDDIRPKLAKLNRSLADDASDRLVTLATLKPKVVPYQIKGGRISLTHNSQSICNSYLDVGRAVPIILTGVLGVCWPTILAPSRGDDVGGGETFLSFPPEVSSLQELSDWLSDDESEIVE